MISYEFKCQKCNKICEVKGTFEEGPPSVVNCDCGCICERIYNCSFILKGSDWPGKEIKKKDFRGGKAREEIEEEHNQMTSDQKLADEVLAVRRKGKKAVSVYKKEHPDRFRDYVKNMGHKGVKGQ